MISANEHSISRHSLIMSALAVAIVVVGMRIPIPNVDIYQFVLQVGLEEGYARASLLALGTLPLLPALALGQCALLLAHQPKKQNGYKNWGRLLVGLIVVIFAIMQGYGVLSALMSVNLMDYSSVNMIIGLACFVASSMVMLWLCDGISLPGVDSGFWLLITIFVVAEIPFELAKIIQEARAGFSLGAQVYYFSGAVLISSVLVVILNRLLTQAAFRNSESQGAFLNVLLWPPLLASSFLTILFSAAPSVLQEMDGFGSWGSSIVISLHYLFLMPIFVYGYYVLIPKNRRARYVPIYMAVCAVQILICMGLNVLNNRFFVPLSLDGAELIALVTVFYAMWCHGAQFWDQRGATRLQAP